MQYKMKDVVVEWPHLRSVYPEGHALVKQTHAWRFDKAQNRTIPCPVGDPEACYEVDMLLSREQATGLLEAMRECARTHPKTQGKNLELKSEDVFKKIDGLYKKTARNKTWGQEGREPTHYLLDGTKLTPTYELNSDSKVHVNLWLEGYSFGTNHGIRVKIDALMVVHQAERRAPKDDESREHPFKDEIQASTSNGAVAHPFATELGINEAAPTVDPNPNSASADIDDEIPF